MGGDEGGFEGEFECVGEGVAAVECGIGEGTVAGDFLVRDRAAESAGEEAFEYRAGGVFGCEPTR